MFTIQSFNTICRNVVQCIKTLSVTRTRDGLQMSWIRNDPYAKNLLAAIASNSSKRDITDKTISKLEAMFNAYVCCNADRTNQAEYFVGQHASEKVAPFDIKQIREEVQQARMPADQCKPKVKEKLHAFLDSAEEKLGHMEYARLQRWDSDNLSKAERDEMQKQLGYFPQALSGRPTRDWAQQVLTKYPRVEHFYQKPLSFEKAILTKNDGTTAVIWSVPKAP